MVAFNSFAAQYLAFAIRNPTIDMHTEPAFYMAEWDDGDAETEHGGGGGNCAPAPFPGGSSSETSSETSACEQQQVPRRRNKKRKVRDGDETAFEYAEIADAIHQFREAYVEIETNKIESKKKVFDHQTKMATKTHEMEEQRFKCMMEAQLAMTKIAEAVKGALDRCLESKSA